MRYVNGIVATLGVAFAINAQAATIIEQDFEGLVTPNYGSPVFVANNPINAGYYGTGSEGEWYGINSPATSNAQASSGSQSVVFTPRLNEQGDFAGDRQLIARNSSDGFISGEFEFSLRMFQQTSGDVNNSNWYLVVSNSANRGAALTELSLRGLGSNLYVAFNGAPSEGAVSLPGDEWFGLRIVGSLDSQTYSTYIDTGSGWLVVDKDRAFNAAIVRNAGSLTDNDLDGFQFVSNGGYQGANNTTYIDDLYIGTPIPEPVALGAVGMIGLMLMRRRR